MKTAKLETIKLNKQKLESLWVNGGRKTSFWCNYYLVKYEDHAELVEKANIYAHLVFVLLLPIVSFLFVLALLYKALEFILEHAQPNVKPLSKSFMTLFSKEKVRTDWVYLNEVQRLEDCK